MNDRVKGILCSLGASFSFAAMSALVHLAGDLPTMQKAFFRNAVALLIAAALLWKDRIRYRPTPRTAALLLGRACFGMVGLFGNFYAIDRLVLSDASMLNKMSPFFAILASRVALKEKLSARQALAVGVAFGGVLLVLKPTAGLVSAPALVGLLGGLGAGLAYTCVRVMKGYAVPGRVIVFVFSLMSTAVCLPFMLRSFTPMSVAQWLCLVMAGCMGAAGQFCITAAYTFAPARELSVYDYAQVLFAAGLGWLLFGQMPDGWSVVGYGLIIGMGVYMFLYNRKIDKLSLQCEKI